ncbi:thioredoxin family protein [Psychroflexus sp. MES1-P1E]|jgi:thioredoxin-related protein|uniref:thioredoxin family protein n=1 Tax=Psychroflexus sp. MES1-P1E TaxID=2058320 RepID=UPI000C7E129B|nr:thioredoxin family protein [Psychroflexus sp. MES1-P1E]PKG42992.1 thioredoxin family protein [Psychroflexus sp. MES1-P1E]
MKLTALIIFLCLGLTSFAQDWTYDMEEAKTQATKDNKDILLVFSGSDWCAPCIKLDRQIWRSEQFKAHASEKLILVRADFPKRKSNKQSKAIQEKNNALAAEYNTSGYFPFVLLLNSGGKVLNKLGYKNLSPTKYITALYAK